MPPARQATKMKAPPDKYDTSKNSSQKANTLCRVTSIPQRTILLEKAALILKKYEEALLPSHGGRNWQVRVIVKEGGTGPEWKKGPLFRWYGAELELGVLPALIENVEERVVVPKYKCLPKVPADRFADVPATDILRRNETDRGFNTTAEAKEDSQKVVVKRHWISPDMKVVKFFKDVLDECKMLANRDILINKFIYGTSASGNFLAPKLVSKDDALNAGHARFLKDGLWVVGQEESWQDGNQAEIERKKAIKDVKAKEREILGTMGGSSSDKSEELTMSDGLRISPQNYYVMMNRVAYRETRLNALKQEKRKGVNVNAIPGPDGVAVTVPPPVAQPIISTTPTGKVTFTLTAAVKELKTMWRTLDQAEKDKWQTEAVAAASNPNFDSVQLDPKLYTKSYFTTPPPGQRELSPLVHFVNESRNNHQQTRLTELEFLDSLRAKEKLKAAIADQAFLIKKLEKEAEKARKDNEKAVAKAKKMKEKAEREGKKAANLPTVLAKDLPQIPPLPVLTEQQFRTKIKFLLSDAQKELRDIWKNKMSDEEKEQWKVAANAKNAEIKQEKKNNAEAKRKQAKAPAAPIVEGAMIKTEPAESGDGSTNGGKANGIDEAQLTDEQKLLNYYNSLVDQQCRLYDAQTDNWQSALCVSYNANTSLHRMQFSKKKFIDLDINKNKIIWEKNRAIKKGGNRSFCLSDDKVEMCLDAAVEHYERVMYTVNTKMLFQELQEGFDVLRERGFGRYDMTVLEYDKPEFSFLTAPDAPWMPIVHKCLGQNAQLVHKGCFISLPGAATQVYHQDGVHLHSTIMKPVHAVNVFIPLIDMTKELGGTEFCLGTHILHNEGYVPTRCETPIGPAGVPYIFDYRLGHRGMGNSSDEVRPVLYLTYSIDARFSDKVNFNARSYHKLGVLLEKPKSREERGEMRRQRSETKETVETPETGQTGAGQTGMEVESTGFLVKEEPTVVKQDTTPAKKSTATIPKKKRPVPSVESTSNKKAKHTNNNI